MQHALAALLLLLAVAARAQPTDWQARAGLKTPLAPGQATVTNGQELLEALADGVGDITLAGESRRHRSHRPALRAACMRLLETAFTNRRPTTPAAVAGDIVLTPADMQQFDLPFNLNTSGAVVLLHSGGLGAVRPRATLALQQ